MRGFVDDVGGEEGGEKEGERWGEGTCLREGWARFDWLAGGVPKRGVEGEEIQLASEGRDVRYQWN